MEVKYNKYNLILIEELEALLGYSDLKYTRNWCRENEIPILKIGKRRYIHSWMFEIALLREIKIESNHSGMDGNEIVNAILNDDKIRLAEHMNVPLDDRLIQSSKMTNKRETVEDIFNKHKKVG
jgi:hypothetical protein